MSDSRTSPGGDLRQRLHTIIFEADTPAGKAFDIALFVAIAVSVLVVMLDSVAALHLSYGPLFVALEWGFTIAFTIEYILRLSCVGKPTKYARSFFGIVDLLSILPTYLSLVLAGTKYLLIIRVLRLLRIFRVMKLVQFVGESNYLAQAFWASRRKILVFLLFLFLMVIVFGSVMYVIEGPANGFSSIPRSIYWAIVTMTTVGYGDISPQTNLGQAVASLVMICGYGIIAIPTGIVTSELTLQGTVSTQACPECGIGGQAHGAKYCKACGASMGE
jgi:voltage-gated potassium channel